MNYRQKQVEKFWNDAPCDSNKSDLDKYTLDFYLQIEADRYAYQVHILSVMDSIQFNGKKILEIGTGVGTDARYMINKGATYSGINVDNGSVYATKNALLKFNLAGEVKKMSATSIDFEKEQFDVVYSFGVLHHIPEAEKAILEIQRVLKQGGELLIMVYNKTSINYYIEIMFLRKLVVKLLGLPGLIDILSVLGFPKKKLLRHREIQQSLKNISKEKWISINTDGPDNPYSRVYDKTEIEILLKGFTVISHYVCFFDKTHWGLLGNLLPNKVIKILGNLWGWHRIVYAVKN